MCLSVLALAGCGGKKDSGSDGKKPPAGEGQGSGDSTGSGSGPVDQGISLTVPREDWDASHYCGTVRPDIPQDPTPYHRFDRSLINSKLQGDGLTGWMHGAVPMYKQYIFTYRKEDPNDFMAFFKAEQFALVPASPAVAQILATLKRHDKVVLKGSFFENGSPVGHIKVTALTVAKRYELALENPYTFDPKHLEGRESFEVFGQVHATAYEASLGHALVIEHKDMILPVAVDPRHNRVAATVWKGDIVNVAVRVVQHPHSPPHLVTDGSLEKGIEVVDPLLNCHNQERTVTGFLVKFDKSPAISTDVYAVRVRDTNGIARNYTFFPSSTDQQKFMDVFMAVSAKAKKAWDGDTSEARIVRNFRSKEGIRVIAKGRINVVSTEQANAQVYLDSADNLTFEAAAP